MKKVTYKRFALPSDPTKLVGSASYYERDRRAAWHATFNAALFGRRFEDAVLIAERAHGLIDMIDCEVEEND